MGNRYFIARSCFGKDLHYYHLNGRACVYNRNKIIVMNTKEEHNDRWNMFTFDSNSFFAVVVDE